MNQESKRPITVEDLLRLKRAEQPAAEFWQRFDHELRAKQLAALVEKRPWWGRLPAVLSGFSRISLPLGASAALAITFIATRDYSPAPLPQNTTENAVAAVSAAGQPEQVAVMREDSPRVMAANVSAAPVNFSSRPAAPVAVARAQYFDQSSDADLDVATSAGAEASFAVARMEVEESSPSQRHIAANLAAAQAAAPALVRGLLGGPRDFEERAMPARFATEPLEQVSTPVERSRARFATAMVASFNGDTRGRVSSANVARRISDERLYDEDVIRRVGATGNSVAWRF